MCIILHNGHSHTHHHSHTHSHANELLEGDKAEKPKTSMRTRTASTSSINVKAAMIHVIGDLLQSIGLLVAVAIIWFRVSNSWYMYWGIEMGEGLGEGLITDRTCLHCV